MTGLVVSSTSGPATARRVSIDPAMSRGRRLKRSVKWAAELHSQPRRGQRAGRCAMVTLTYAAVDGWDARHVSLFLQRVRKWLSRRGHHLRYTWVAELQKRGAVHYHVLVWLPRGLTMPKPDKQGWWPHGSTQVVWARKPVGYICKYASKFDSVGQFPKGIRLHGSGGFREQLEKDVRHWLALPTWVRQQVGVGQRMRRLEGGGLVAVDTGQVVRSPWRFSWSREGGAQARELFRYADGIAATGPYSRIGHPDFKREELIQC